MGTMSVNKLGGLSLILGPVLAFVFFLIQPGAMIIDSADLSDPVASITAAASNVVLSNLTAIMIALGLVVTTYGIYVLQSSVRGGNGGALAQAGFTLILFGNVGWVLAQGLTLVLADAQSPEALQRMVPVYSVRSGIVLMSGLAVSLGFLVLSLSFCNRDILNKVAALIVAVVSIVALVSFTIGISDNSRVDTMIMIARICYIAWVLWPIMLGVSLFMEKTPASAK